MHMSEVPEENGARLLLERSKKHLTHEERVAFGFIAACGIGAVIFGGLSFFSNVKKPFLISYTGPRYITSAEKESEQTALQRITDTDEDGVSDYDELNIFSTSPYIEDTDSDGKLDGLEILEGGDPNCATGKTCASSELIQLGVNSAFLNAQAPQAPNTAAVPTVDDAVSVLKNLSTGEVRRLLEESGVDAEQLAQLSDEQVMVVYEEILGQAITEIQNTAEEGTETAPETAPETASP
jgi:hypothetical protein